MAASLVLIYPKNGDQFSQRTLIIHLALYVKYSIGIKSKAIVGGLQSIHISNIMFQKLRIRKCFRMYTFRLRGPNNSHVGLIQ